MKILIANKFYYNRGGDCTYTIGLKNLLEQKGHKSAVFSSQHERNYTSEFNMYWPSEVNFNSLKNIGKLVSRPIYSIEVKKRFTEIIKIFRPDIIHLNNIHSQLSPLIAKVAFEHSIPLVWTLHDYKLICPNYTFLSKNKICEACLKFKPSVIAKRCIKDNLLASVLGYAENLIWNRRTLERYVDYFICPSQFLYRKMLEGGFSPRKLVQIYNFFDDESFASDSSTVKENYYVYFGRLSYEKGLTTLLNAAKTIQNINLKIVGDGPLLKELKERYQSFHHISFLGFKEKAQLKSILSRAKFFVIPSEWYENNPISILEAFSLGLPGIGANIGGIPELIKNGITGYLFKPGDARDLKSKIEKLSTQDSLFGLSANCKKAAQNFSKESHYNQLIKVYNRSLKSSG